MNRMSETIWNYGEGGAILGIVVSTVGVAVNTFLGGWDKMLSALLLFMVLDYITGVVASLKNKTTNSQVMFWGGVNKILVLSLVGVGVILDGILGNLEPIVRTAIIWFYIARESLSLVENYGKMGLPLPTKIQEVLTQLTNKGGA